MGYTNDGRADLWSTRRLVHQGESFDVVSVSRVTGCGPRFDGRVRVELARVSDGMRFGWLSGSRHTKRIPSNAKLTPKGI